jgi:hypothetical protein
MSDPRDIVVNNVVVSLNGDNLPTPLSFELGTQAIYHEPDETDLLGSWVVYRPTLLRMTLPITNAKASKELRKIASSEEQMQKDHKITVRYYAATRKTPFCTTNLQNVRFLLINHVKGPGHRNQTVADIMAKIEKVVHEG